jgi:diaminopimelate decarboxylase
MIDGAAAAAQYNAHADSDDAEQWQATIVAAAERYGTPCYVGRWQPVHDAAVALERLLDSPVPLRSWLSFKTHPLPPLVRDWIDSGRSIEVVSEVELYAALRLGCPVDRLLVNGVGKHAWLLRHPLPRLRVHFDSEHELDSLLPIALEHGWRVGIRCHAPDERDARDPRFGGPFGMTAAEAIRSLRRLNAAGADVQSIHFHLGQRPQECDAYTRAVEHVADICDRAAFTPRYIDCGGGLPSRSEAGAALQGLAAAIRTASARFEQLEEIWLENGRFITDASTALAVRIVDVKERPESRYLICDGGRTNHALAADKGLHPLRFFPERHGAPTLTTICGPTCMTDDTLGRVMAPRDLQPGDLIAWMHAGAYHLPWETRFSHGLSAVAWRGADDILRLARPHEPVDQWSNAWNLVV